MEHGSTSPQQAEDAVEHGATSPQQARGDAVEHDSADSQQASDAAGDGGAVTVTVEGVPGGFAVADDGVGIPAEERDRVFEPGYSTADDGTGLGLDIVREVAQAHGWAVALGDSADGTRFEVTGADVIGED